MGKKKVTKGKTTKKAARQKNPLFESTPRSFRIGQSIQHKRNLTRFVRWPKYVMLQRQKRILFDRMKVPPVINQFTHTLDTKSTNGLIKFLKKYSPETKVEKKNRLSEQAKNKVEGKSGDQGKKPVVLKYGLNHITTLIEEKKAKLVVVAGDVDPIELVLWLPRLCKKMDIPYCFVKGKARLGTLVHKKNATAVAIVDVKGEDKATLDQFQKSFRTQFVDNIDIVKKWGGGNVGIKSTHKRELLRRAIEKEALKKANL